MAVSLGARLQDAAGIVDPTRVPLKAQEHLFRGGRAVNTVQLVSRRVFFGCWWISSHTKAPGKSPVQPDGRCGCGSESMPKEAEAPDAAGRSRLQVVNVSFGIPEVP